MKLFQKLLAIFIGSMIMIAILSACGEEKNAASDDKKSGEEATTVVETVAVLETTAEGGTIEQDPEGNRITRDNTGKVVKVEDKDGNPISVDTYLITHTWVENPGSAGGGSDSPNPDSNNSGGGKNTSGGSKDPSSGSSSQDDKDPGKSDDNVQPTDANGDIIEESIPVIIATIPDDDDDIPVLPDL